MPILPEECQIQGMKGQLEALSPEEDALPRTPLLSSSCLPHHPAGSEGTISCGLLSGSPPTLKSPYPSLNPSCFHLPVTKPGLAWPAEPVPLDGPQRRALSFLPTKELLSQAQ